MHYFAWKLELVSGILWVIVDTGYGWLHPTADSSSGDWIRAAADSILQLTLVLTVGFNDLVLAAGYKLTQTRVSSAGFGLRMILSCNWLWIARDSRSGGWMRVTADSILWLTRVLAAGYNLRLIPSCGYYELWLTRARVPVAGYELQLILYCCWLQVAANFILRLTRIPPAWVDLQLTYILI